MSVKYRLAFRQTLCGYRYERNRSRDLHSSFRDTIIHANENSHWRRTLTWRQSSKRSIKSNGTDVVVMIAPIAGNENSRRASVNWRKTFLRVTMGSKLAKNKSPDRCSEIIDENEISSPRSKVSIQVETCIWNSSTRAPGFSRFEELPLFRSWDERRCEILTEKIRCLESSREWKNWSWWDVNGFKGNGVGLTRGLRYRHSFRYIMRRTGLRRSLKISWKTVRFIVTQLYNISRFYQKLWSVKRKLFSGIEKKNAQILVIDENVFYVNQTWAASETDN